MSITETESFYPEDCSQWNAWLRENHDKKQAVWLIYYPLRSGVPTISWSEAVDEALCFGWIDSKKKPLEGGKYMQFFSRRKARSPWSKINKEKVQQLTDAGRMAKAGLDCIAKAKQNGCWTILDEAETLSIPKDLEAAFKARPGSIEFFMSCSKSTRKAILQWLILARQAATREKRINEIAGLAQQGLKPKQF